ncbi:hypothetical protein [Parabacteroides sp.]
MKTKVRNKIYLLCLLAISSLATIAQQQDPSPDIAGRNTMKTLYMGELNYSHSDNVGSVLTKALQGQIATQDKSQLPALAAGIRHGASTADRVTLSADDPYQIDFVLGGQREGEHFLLEGTVSSISNTTVVDGKTLQALTGKTNYATGSYKATIVLTLSLRDLVTNATLKSYEIKRECTTYNNLSTVESVMAGAIEMVTEDVRERLNHLFPLYGSIIEQGESKKDKLKEAYIDLGSNWNLEEGRGFKVYSLKSIAGREVREEIGKLKVNKVQGDDISLCKITKGGKEILAAMEAGKTVVVIAQ